MDDLQKQRLESVKSGNRGWGQAKLIKYLNGGKITQRQAIQAKCYDCNGMGEVDHCDDTACSLYPYSPCTKGKLAASTSRETESSIG